MTYEFLKSFHKRAEIIAITESITTRVSKKVKLREYGINGNESINLVMLVLCFIMEKSLLEEICTKNDIATYIGRLDGEYLKKGVPNEEYVNVADFLVKECLQNNGVPHYFDTYNFEVGQEEKINIKLIDDKRIEFENEGVYSYYMTPQGYKFMFNTLEIEETLQVSIEQFKLSLSIKKRNFGAARANVDSLFNIGKTQIQRINYFIKKVKEDIGSAGIGEYEEIYNHTFASIDEQKEGYDSLYELIAKAEDSIMEGGRTHADQEALEREVANIAYIKGKLKFIINEQSNLLLKQQELQKVYDEAVDNILYIGFENRLNFEDAVLKRLEGNPDLSEPLVSILRPLFKPRIHKLFHMGMALREQKFAGGTVVEGNNVLMSNRYFSHLEGERDVRIRVLNEQYLSIFETIVSQALDGSNQAVTLSELLLLPEGEYGKLVPELKVLTNVLLQLTNLAHVDFTTINRQKAKTVFNPSEEFDVKYCVLSLLNKDERYQAVSSLKIVISRHKTVFVPEWRGKTEEFGPSEEGVRTGMDFGASTTTGLRCPDILFQVEGR